MSVVRWLSDPRMVPIELSERQTWRLLRTFYRQPEKLGRHQYLRRLRWSDHEFIKRLDEDGASTADELRRSIWTPRDTRKSARPHSETAFITKPSSETVRDWLTLAWRRGLIEGFTEPQRPKPGPEPLRWALTDKGEQLYRRPTSGLRIATAALEQLAKAIVWLIGLVVGSAVLLESVREVDLGEITGSTAFEVSAAVLGVASFLLVLAALFEYVRRTSALGLIELTRRYGEVASLDYGGATPTPLSTAKPEESQEPPASTDDNSNRLPYAVGAGVAGTLAAASAFWWISRQ